MSDYKSKYLKYKKKYLELKQTGGFLIGNYHLQGTELAMAEAITHGTLSEQMTQHGLGTGIYGFINWTETNRGADTYRKPEYDITLHTIHNPIILQNEWKLEGEKYTDLGNFTFLSMNLNILLYTLYNMQLNMQLNINTMIDKELIRIITEIFEKNKFYPQEDGTYIGIPNDPTTIQEIIRVVRAFLKDYNTLMTTLIEQENYILMPINYLAYVKRYDGILNRYDDSGRTGSIKYCFDRNYDHCKKARGYRPIFKWREPLHGQLIFTAP